MNGSTGVIAFGVVAAFGLTLGIIYLAIPARVSEFLSGLQVRRTTIGGQPYRASVLRVRIYGVVEIAVGLTMAYGAIYHATQL